MENSRIMDKLVWEFIEGKLRKKAVKPNIALERLKRFKKKLKIKWENEKQRQDN